MSTVLTKISAQKAARTLRLLGSETRLRILSVLSQTTGDMCVNEIANAIGLSQSATSHQLARLEASGVVIPHRMGQTVCYTLSDSAAARDVIALMRHWS